ncbi:radial spoke head protein 9 homolog [Nilaparvata lugens]|uniref:radial spoke head protein 9 homolog n=1 Tax=Nilaparvata lugens TaxID=108931 RepID=UPI00193E165B|nr:radial spoke head protein 9 homolog [Nilaparvata lugens]
MDIDRFLNGFEGISHFGIQMNEERKAILSNSLVLLKNDNHFSKIFYWGEIDGVLGSYFISYGYHRDALRGRQFYYSTNCFEWVLLPKPTPLDMYLSLNFYVRFQGDPSYGTTIEERIRKKLEKVNDHGDNVLINEGKLKEENRLAATVHLINDETAVVPRGAYVKRPNGLIEPNQSFQGLQLIESDDLKSYLHFRSPTQKWNSNLLTRRDYNYSFDFLDPLDADLPEGQFILDNSRNGYRLATIRSLTWPGYYFYHFINTPEYGSMYVGNGRKNLDVPFMLF